MICKVIHVQGARTTCRVGETGPGGIGIDQVGLEANLGVRRRRC